MRQTGKLRFLRLMLKTTLVQQAVLVLPCLCITLYLDVRESQIFRLRKDSSDLQCGTLGRLFLSLEISGIGH